MLSCVIIDLFRYLSLVFLSFSKGSEIDSLLWSNKNDYTLSKVTSFNVAIELLTLVWFSLSETCK